jgi:hypothetical protein
MLPGWRVNAALLRKVSGPRRRITIIFGRLELNSGLVDRKLDQRRHTARPNV